MVLLGLFGVSLAWKTSASSVGVDFYQFWVTGQASARPLNVYSDDARAELGAEFAEKARQTGDPRLRVVAEYRHKLETYSTPFLYTAFRTFSTRAVVADWSRYRAALIACLAFGVAVLGRLMNHGWDTIFGTFAIFVAWFEPLLPTYGWGT